MRQTCVVYLASCSTPQVLGSEPRLYTVTLPSAGSKTLTLANANKPVLWA